MTVPERVASPLTISLFGPFEVSLNGDPLPRLRSRKGPWLLALLTLRYGRVVERAWLAGTLWPDNSESQALALLRRDLTNLRRAFGQEGGRLRSPSPHTLCLDLAGAAVDVVAFDQAIREGDTPSLERAVALYRGPLLEGWTEEWVFQERQAREEAYLAALETLAAQALTRGEPLAAERYLRRTVAVDPLRETAQRALMQSLAASGNYAAAMQTYRELRLLLHREINAEPDVETTALFQQLRAEARGKADGRRQAGDGKRQTVDRQAQRHPDESDFAELPSPLSRLPSGTITFLFTDIEGSPRLWEEHPAAMREALARHDALLTAAVEAHDGHVFKKMGDQVCAAFATAPAALAAALAAQRALQVERWGEGDETLPERLNARTPERLKLRVRMALHTGAAEERDGDYLGPPLIRVARLLEAGHGGQVLLSQPTADLARDHLPEGADLRDLGERRLKDLVRPERVFQLVIPNLPADFPPLQSLEAFPHNLPVQLTSFIGREGPMAEVKQRLATHRLVTLSGAGGCGKTRLALQMAAELVEAYAEGVWFVELAPLADPALVPQAVAAALRVREQPGQPLTLTLVAFLRTQQLLLVLDNCEHLVGACARLAETLLQACPHLRILATSREALGIPGEMPYRVPSLALPDMQQRPTLERLTQYEAVRFFIDRAVTAVAEFRVTNENAPAVAAVCQRLEGIPLAIELAAARLKALPVEKIHERLDDMFRLLTGGSRTALPRQQTLRALIDWSYDLLTESERALLRRLSVFAGGWTLEAAEAVSAGEGIEAWDVLDLLTQLVAKSLAIYEEQSGAGRYRLLETVRQYARDRLLESGEGPAARDRHLAYFVGFAEQAEPGLRGEEPQRWLDQCALEHDNLRAALQWGQAAEDTVECSPGGWMGLRLVAALWPFWHSAGHLWEGWEWLEKALQRAEGSPAALRAKALRGAAVMAGSRINHATVLSFVEESLALFRELGDRASMADLLPELAYRAHRFHSDPARARSLLEERLTLLRELGDQAGLARAFAGLGVFSFGYGQGDIAAARTFHEHSLALWRQLGDRKQMIDSLAALAHVASEQGDEAAVRRLHQERLVLAQEWGGLQGAAAPLLSRAALARLRGDRAVLVAVYTEGLALRREWGNAEGVSRALHALAGFAWDHGDYEAARSLFEERLALLRELGRHGSGTEGQSGVLFCLSRVARSQGDPAAARAYGEQSLAMDREIGKKGGVAINLKNLGLVALQQGDLATGRSLMRQSLIQHREVGHQWGLCEGLEGMAHLAAAQDQPERAARLFGAAEAEREKGRFPFNNFERQEYSQGVAGIRASLGEEVFAAAWAEGRMLTLERAIEYGLAEAGNA